jgi:hypothetical protein
MLVLAIRRLAMVLIHIKSSTGGPAQHFYSAVNNPLITGAGRTKGIDLPGSTYRTRINHLKRQRREAV